MKRRTRTTTHRSNAKKAQGKSNWKYNFFCVVCVIFLLGSLFFAGRNHFASINNGFKNAQLRKDIEDLQAEKRKLTLSKEMAMSPAEIDKAARKLGFTPMTARNIEGVSTGSDVAKNAQTGQKQPAPMLASLNAPTTAKKVVKTGLVTPADSQRTRN